MGGGHELGTERVGVGLARCWIVVCSCGWKKHGSTSTRRQALELVPRRCPEATR